MKGRKKRETLERVICAKQKDSQLRFMEMTCGPNPFSTDFPNTLWRLKEEEEEAKEEEEEKEKEICLRGGYEDKYQLVPSTVGCWRVIISFSLV